MRIVVITSTRPYTGKSGIALALIGILASLGVLTGRRKLLVVISVFLST